MMCGMCEAHINDAVRAAVPVKKVSSSRSKGETIILSESALNHELVKTAITSKGYTVQSISEEMIEKKPMFGFLRH